MCADFITLTHSVSTEEKEVLEKLWLNGQERGKLTCADSVELGDLKRCQEYIGTSFLTVFEMKKNLPC